AQVYIVYLGNNQNEHPLLTTKSHLHLLSNVFASMEDAQHSLLYSYRHHFSGFSAKLNATQASILTKKKAVISVFRSKTLQLHTTRSWDFMGLSLDDKKMHPLQLAYGSNIVVGVLDTGKVTTAMVLLGVWPESESFKEDPSVSSRPLPLTWKGKCVEGEKFDPLTACNSKLIGARYYLRGFEEEFGLDEGQEYRSARDFLGHGTHTASTAVGSIVENASFLGFGRGTARGGAPRAQLAIYKICWSKDLNGACTEADILAAFDDAVHDGVHIISASFGSSPPLAPFFGSSAGIGSFHAMQAGISNDGPDLSLVQNVAPWALCVAASTTDRTFPTLISIDSNITIMGESLISQQITARLADARTYFNNGECKVENWNKKAASGRVILCFSTSGWVSSGTAEAAVFRANGSALIFAEPITRQLAEVDVIPTIRVDLAQGTRILDYLILSPKLPIVKIEPSTTTIRASPPAPRIAYFSSRGPSSISPDILKPDLAAPGINILAAWPPTISPTQLPHQIDGRSVQWNLLSGTSMSCPHTAGIVALLKSAHPNWSPAAIRSALMTTADTRDKTSGSILAIGSMKRSDVFDMGAGHINPLKAIDPGLIYDMKPSDYSIFLCNLGYTDDQINSMMLPQQPQRNRRCPAIRVSNADLNYPSIVISGLERTSDVKRTLTDVASGKTASVYFARVSNPDGVDVVVWPRVLIFTPTRREVTYFVVLTPLKESGKRYDVGEIVWSNGFYSVRTPLVVSVNTSNTSLTV
ncbi:hypothetical protein V2J09_001073, partial [Rumex salicifolius]